MNIKKRINNLEANLGIIEKPFHINTFLEYVNLCDRAIKGEQLTENEINALREYNKKLKGIKKAKSKI